GLEPLKSEPASYSQKIHLGEKEHFQAGTTFEPYSFVSSRKTLIFRSVAARDFTQVRRRPQYVSAQICAGRLGVITLGSPGWFANTQQLHVETRQRTASINTALHRPEGVIRNHAFHFHHAPVADLPLHHLCRPPFDVKSIGDR